LELLWNPLSRERYIYRERERGFLSGFFRVSLRERGGGVRRKKKKEEGREQVEWRNGRRGVIAKSVYSLI